MFGRKKKSVNHAFEIAAGVVEEIKQLASTDHEKAQKVLFSAWATHARDYQQLAVHAAKTKGDEKADIQSVIAFAILHAYFEHRGDWTKMKESIKEKIS